MAFTELALAGLISRTCDKRPGLTNEDLTIAVSKRIAPLVNRIAVMYAAASGRRKDLVMADGHHARTIYSLANTQTRSLVEVIAQLECQQIINGVDSLRLLSNQLRQRRGRQSFGFSSVRPNGITGDPHSDGTVRGFRCDHEEWYVRPRHGHLVEWFARLIDNVLEDCGGHIYPIDYIVVGDYAFVRNVSRKSFWSHLSAVESYTAGILIAVCQALGILDLHDQNVWRTSNGWAVIDLEVVLAPAVSGRFIHLAGETRDIHDTPLASSLLPLWLRQVPRGYAFRSGVCGWRTLGTDEAYAIDGDAKSKWCRSCHSLRDVLSGYRSVVEQPVVLDKLIVGATSLIGRTVRDARQATVNYGIVMDRFFNDVVIGDDASSQLEVMLNAMGDQSVSLSARDIKHGCVPIWSRTVKQGDIDGVASRIDSMKCRATENCMLIKRAMTLAGSDALGVIDSASRGDLSQ